MATHVLPDILAPNLKVVFCGTAASSRSAAVGAYYAGRGNKFWKTLHEVGLTPRIFEPREFVSLVELGLGLTDLTKLKAGEDDDLEPGDFDVVSFRRKIELYKPLVVAFNGKRAAREVLGRSPIYGRQAESVAHSELFVLPSTSGAASRYWNVKYWHELAQFVGGLGSSGGSSQGPVCPSCGLSKVIPIVYGVPDEETLQQAEQGNIALGGGSTGNDRTWYCKRCSLSFS